VSKNYAVNTLTICLLSIFDVHTELAKGDSIAAFYWNTGGTWANRAWDQDLPTDSQVGQPTTT